MIDALWAIEFKLPDNSDFGSGVAVIETGKVLGGDSSFSYIGSVSVKDGIASARIHCKKYSNKIRLSSISGVDDYMLDATGPIDPSKMRLIGTSPSIPNFKLIIEMTRIAELP